LTRPKPASGGLSTAEDQALNFIDVVTLFTDDLPPALDVESTAVDEIIADLGKEGAAEFILEFLDWMRKVYNVHPILYMGKPGIDKLRPEVDLLGTYDLWYARPGPKNKPPSLPQDAAGDLIFPNWTIWQQGKAKVDGIPGPPEGTDQNLFNGNQADLDQWIVGSGAP
jgi:GH25 family lysozyme M1 (1,4-beta-N-acetylmuramidase)